MRYNTHLYFKGITFEPEGSSGEIVSSGCMVIENTRPRWDVSTSVWTILGPGAKKYQTLVQKYRTLVWGNPGPRCGEISKLGGVTSHPEPLTQWLTQE